MKAEAVLEFLMARGMKVVKTASCAWYNEYRQERVYQAFPLHRLITPSRAEIKEVFAKQPKAVAVRFLSAVDGPGRTTCLWVRRGDYDLASVHSKSRNQTRRGLERFEVRELGWNELAEKGWEAHRDTAARHGLQPPKSLGLDVGLGACAAYSAWGAFAGEDLAAYLVALKIDDWVEILVQRSANAYLKLYPNNALVFTAVKHYLSQPGVATVSYGLEGIEGMSSSLGHFKESMGFDRLPVRQKIVVRGWLNPLFNCVTCWGLEKAASLRWFKRRGWIQKGVGFARTVQASR